MREALFLLTLVLFLAGGLFSGVLLATDWNGWTTEEHLVELGVLLFFVGTGIGAALSLLILGVLKLFKKKKFKSAIPEDYLKSTPQQENKDAQLKDVYNIQVHQLHASCPSDIKISDATLLNKLGLGVSLGVKKVMHQVSKKLVRWDSDPTNVVYTPTRKGTEKGGASIENIQAPTPRIYVLPPDSPMSKGGGMSLNPCHMRSRSALPSIGKVGMPDVSILDIPNFVRPSDELDVGPLSTRSGASSHDTSQDLTIEIESGKPTSIGLPSIRTIENQLDTFVQTLNPTDTKLTYMLSIMIEEVLPRPDSGLLKRMLRMSEIPVGIVEGSGEPVLHLRVGSECHISIGLIKIHGNGSNAVDISGPHSIKLKPIDGESMELNPSSEAVDREEHVCSAFWDLKSHASDSLTCVSSGDASSNILTPIEMTLGFHVHFQDRRDLIREIEVKKTFMASMRGELISLDVDQRFVYGDAVYDFVLSKMELISMPSLLMFLEVDTDSPTGEDI